MLEEEGCDVGVDDDQGRHRHKMCGVARYDTPSHLRFGLPRLLLLHELLPPLASARPDPRTREIMAPE